MKICIVDLVLEDRGLKEKLEGALRLAGCYTDGREIILTHDPGVLKTQSVVDLALISAEVGSQSQLSSVATALALAVYLVNAGIPAIMAYSPERIHDAIEGDSAADTAFGVLGKFIHSHQPNNYFQMRSYDECPTTQLGATQTEVVDWVTILEEVELQDGKLVF